MDEGRRRHVLSPASLNVRCVFRSDSGSLTLDVPPSETSAWRAIARVLRSPLDAVSCALLPALCSLCGSPLPQFSSVPICGACWAEMPALSGSACARCGDTLNEPEIGTAETICRACRMAPPMFLRSVAYSVYEGRVRDAIHALKYDRIHSAARRLGYLLALAIGQLAAEAPAQMLVIPVPLHRSKHTERGFNQARQLAMHALKKLQGTHPEWQLTLAPDTLMRIRATESPAALTPRQRRINVRGAFMVSNEQAIRGRDILLIGDILTTGATARAAAKTLVDAGANSVWVATLARARRIHMRRDSRSARDASLHDAGNSGSEANAPVDEREQASMSSGNQPSF